MRDYLAVLTVVGIIITAVISIIKLVIILKDRKDKNAKIIRPTYQEIQKFGVFLLPAIILILLLMFLHIKVKF